MKASEQMIAMRDELKAKAYKAYNKATYGLTGASTSEGTPILYSPAKGFITKSFEDDNMGMPIGLTMSFLEETRAYEAILGL